MCYDCVKNQSRSKETTELLIQVHEKNKGYPIRNIRQKMAYSSLVMQSMSHTSQHRCGLMCGIRVSQGAPLLAASGG